MKFLKQLAIILISSFLGEVAHAALKLPIPASIYGIIILFTLLKLGAVKPEQVSDTAHFLISVMIVTFVPITAALIDQWELLKSSLIPYVLVITLSTIFVMGAAGKAAQFIIGRRRKK